MKTSIRWMIVPVFLAFCAAGPLGCEDDEGPMEKTGEQVGQELDNAAETVDEAARDAQRNVEDAMD